MFASDKAALGWNGIVYFPNCLNEVDLHLKSGRFNEYIWGLPQNLPIDDVVFDDEQPCYGEYGLGTKVMGESSILMVGSDGYGQSRHSYRETILLDYNHRNS